MNLIGLPLNLLGFGSVHNFHRVVLILTVANDTRQHALYNLACRPVTKRLQQDVLVDLFHAKMLGGAEVA